MAKMGCRPNQRLAQRTGQPDETEEEVVQDSDQSDHSVQVPDSEKSTSRFQRITARRCQSPVLIQNLENGSRKSGGHLITTKQIGINLILM